MFGPVSEGDWIAQTGANSSVGLYMISLAQRAGIHTLNVVSSHEAATQVSVASGDRVVIDGDDPPAQLQRVLGGQELALVLDSIGGPVVTNLADRLRFGEIVALVTSGELTADIDSTFRLEQYADALSRAEHYRRHGKVLFVFGD